MPPTNAVADTDIIIHALEELAGTRHDPLPPLINLFDAIRPARHSDHAQAFLTRPTAGGSERPYGWAWLLALHAELARQDGLGRRDRTAGARFRRALHASCRK